MRVAIYGGSFNPPHFGHAMVAAWALWTRQADEVWLTPTRAHAFGKALAPWELRLAMCRALAGLIGPGVRVCEVEDRLTAPSYTIDALDLLRQEHPGVRFHLLLGADNLPDTPRWKRWDRIEAEFAPIVVGRDGYENPPQSVVFPAISSTAVREGLASGRPVGHWVPEAVLAVMGDHYGPSGVHA